MPRTYITAYPPEVYDDFITALNGQGRVFDRLLKTYPEWAAFANAVLGDEEAIFWLFKHHFNEMGILANALNDEPEAIGWLQAQPDPFLFHLFQAAKGQSESMAFLQQTRYKTFIPMAKAIGAMRKIRIKKQTFWYRVF